MIDKEKFLIEIAEVLEKSLPLMPQDLKELKIRELQESILEAVIKNLEKH
jgi:hypothetical protein